MSLVLRFKADIVCEIQTPISGFKKWVTAKFLSYGVIEWNVIPIKSSPYYFKTFSSSFIVKVFPKNLNGWSSPCRKGYYTLFIVFIWIARSAVIFSKNWQIHIVTNLCADKNGLFTCIFSGRKKTTKEALTGQRLTEMDCILWRWVCI